MTTDAYQAKRNAAIKDAAIECMNYASERQSLDENSPHLFVNYSSNGTVFLYVFVCGNDGKQRLVADKTIYDASNIKKDVLAVKAMIDKHMGRQPKGAPEMHN